MRGDVDIAADETLAAAYAEATAAGATRVVLDFARRRTTSTAPASR